MKKLILLIVLTVSLFNAFAQKKGLNYQAVILDPKTIEVPGVNVTGQPLSNGKVWVRFTLKTSAGVDYEEIQQTTTDEFGLISLTVGTGASTASNSSNATGISKYSTFDSIVWDAELKSLIVAVNFDGGTKYTTVSNQKLNFTPYALYAESVDYKNVRDTPKNLSQFNNDTGYLVPKDLDPLKTNIALNSKAIADNQATNEGKFIVVNQTIEALDKKVKADITNINSTLDDHNNRINSTNNQLTNTANTLSSQIGYVQNITEATANAVNNLGTTYESAGNKSTATDLGGGNPSDVLFPTQKAAKTYVDNAVSIAVASGAPDATTLASGKVQLTGDLGGTATNPTVPGLATKESLSNKSTNVSADAGSDTKYPSVRAIKTYVDQATQGIALQAAVDAKADKNSPVFTGTPSLPSGTTGVTQSPANNSTALATTAFVQGAIASATIVDADATTKGKIQLAGDLGGTAGAPTVPALANKENVSNKSTATALGTSDQLYPTQNAVKTYVDNQVAAATIADATALIKGKLQLAGDLTGTAAAPAIATSAVTTAKIADNAITTAKITDANVTDAKIATVSASKLTGSVAIINGGTGATTATGALTNLGAQATANLSTDVSADAASLTKYPAVKTIKDYVDNSVAAATIADATTTLKGKIQLGGDLAGTGTTAAAPVISDNAITTVKITDANVTTAKLAAAAVTTAKIADASVTNAKIGETITIANGGTGATTAGAALTALGAQATANLSTNITTDAASLTKYPAVKTVKDYVDATVSAATPDATTTAKGKIQLGGDLAGTGTTAAAPVISDNAITSAKISDGAIATADLADASITTAKIANSSVTTAKLSGAVAVANGGTGATSLTANNVILGNGTSAVQLVAPSTAGNVLRSDGTTFASSALNIDDLSDAINEGATGNSNIALGTSAMYSNTGNSSQNVAIGLMALKNTNAANQNVAIGQYTMGYNKTLSGSGNVAIGRSAMNQITSGSNNTAIGLGAGGFAPYTGDFTGSNNTYIGNQASPSSLSASNEIVLGNSSVTVMKTAAKLTTGAVTYPNTDGTSGQVLTTNGSGVASFSNIPATNLASGVTGTLAIANGGTGSTTAGDALTALGAQATANLSTNMTTDAASLTKYPAVKTVKDYVDASVVAATPDADATTKGKIQLAGDLTGTAASPAIAASAVTTAKINDAAVTSAKIADGTIVNADINASAAIADTKLATISTSGKVSNSATTATDANTASAIVARDANGDFAAGTITASLTGLASKASNINGGTLGALPYQSAANTTSLLTGSTSSTKQFLTQTGTGSVSAAPAWGSVVIADVSDLGTGVGGFLGTPTSANLATAVTNETGSGALVFATSPTLVTPTLGVASATSVGFAGSTSGTATIAAPAVAGTTTITLPSASGTLATLAGTETLSNKTFTAPALGTPASGVLTNATGLPLTSGVTGTLPIANGGTGSTTAADALTALGAQATANLSTNVTTDAASLTKYPAVKTIKDYVDASVTSGAPDADATTKGKVQLAGDLTGTAASPAIAASAVTTAKINDAAVTSAKIADGTIVNADINASAAIADTKLATISTSGKVSNSATTADDANTASAIVARDASGNFAAGTITANLTGLASKATNINGGTVGAIPYQSAANTTTLLSGNSSATKKFLTQTGDGTSAAAPVWAGVAVSDITGTLPVANGGTGVTTVAANLVFAGPTSGASAAAPSFRSLVAADLPAGSTNYVINGTTQQASTNFNISGAGTIGTDLTVTGNASIGGTATITGATTLSALTASKGVFTDASKRLTSTGTLGTDQGGTGMTSFNSGGAMYATSTSALTTGTLPTSAGGTGLTSFTSGGALYTTSTSAITTGTLPISAGGTGSTTQNFVDLTTDQTVDGVKTFNSAIKVAGDLPISRGTYATARSIAIGTNSLAILRYASDEIAIGHEVMKGDLRGVNSVGIGNYALTNQKEVGSTWGANNTAIGHQAGYNVTSGKHNVLMGVQSGYTITEGGNNTVIGPGNSGNGITTGNSNTIIGKAAGLAPALSNNVILADGDGNIRAQHDGTSWTVGTIGSGTWNGTAIGVAYGGTGSSTSTGTGAVVLASSPTLVTPNIGTPSAATLTNATGLPLTTGVTGILPIANGGTGSATQNFVDLTTAQTVAGAKTFSSTIVGSISGNAATVTNGVYTTNKLSALSATTSAELAGVISDETGTGTLVFATSPTLVTPTIGVATATSVGFNGSTSGKATLAAPAVAGTTTITLPGATGTLATLDGTETLSNKTFTAPALGTPASGVLTNATGLPLTTGTTGTLPLAKGGTGQTTKAAAFDALSPMSASGDIIYGGASGTGTALAKGTDGQFLTLVSGLPAWSTSSAVTTLAAIGSTANANGASIASNTLTLQPANASFGGVVTTAAQTFAGVKTFSANISANGVVLGRLGTTATNFVIGSSALNSSATSDYNTAVGDNTLTANTSGLKNVAIGYSTMNATTSGSYNVGVGYNALNLQTTGNYNTAIGHETLKNSTTAGSNVVLGYNAGQTITSGSGNVYIGTQAGQYISTGTVANTTGNNSTLIGYNTTPLADGDANEVVLAGYSGSGKTVGLGSNSTLIGNSATTLTQLMGVVNIPNTTTSTSTTSGALKVAGGAGIAGTMYVGGDVDITSTSAATSTTTGSLVVSGGVGIAGATYIGGQLSIAGGTPGAGKVLVSDANGLASWSANSNGGVSSITASATMAATDSYNLIVFSGSTASQTITLPSAATVGAGREITIKNIASVSVGVSSTSGTLISDSTTTAAISLSIGIEPSNNWIKAISNGTNWIILRALF